MQPSLAHRATTLLVEKFSKLMMPMLKKKNQIPVHLAAVAPKHCIASGHA